MTGARASEAIESVVDRVWPNLTAPQFLQDLLGPRTACSKQRAMCSRLREIQTLYRQAGQRSPTKHGRGGRSAARPCPRRISDEAGDRFGHSSSTRLRTCRRCSWRWWPGARAPVSMTVLGDVAQSTGPGPETIGRTSSGPRPRRRPNANIEELEVGYRVPRPAFELAVRCWPAPGAPGHRACQGRSRGPEAEVIETANAHDRHCLVAAAIVRRRRHLVGVICPDAPRSNDRQLPFKSTGVRFSEARRDGLAAPITVVSPARPRDSSSMPCRCGTHGGCRRGRTRA